MANKLKPEIKAAWLTALRSGEYEQGRGALNRGGKFCCLGVLCDVMVNQFDLNLDVAQEPECDDVCCSEVEKNVISYNENASFPPAEVAEAVFMNRESDSNWGVKSMEAPNREMSYTLYALNDNGFSFAEIADVIEEQY